MVRGLDVGIIGIRETKRRVPDKIRGFEEFVNGT